MDDLDKRLYYELKQEDVPSEFRTIIKKSLNNNTLKKKMPKYSLTKIAIVVCISLLATTGIAYASITISNYIFKQPEKTVGFYSEENVNLNTITTEKKDSTMSEAEAIKKAEEILEKFGYKNEKIKIVKLNSNSINYELLWNIETENDISIDLDAKGKNYLRIFCKGLVDDEKIYNYRTTEKQAIKTAKDLCKKYGYNIEKYNDIRVMSNVRNNIENFEDESYIWTVRFAKKYDELVNIYESITISFIPQINRIYDFIIFDTKYENNPVEITKEKATQIALETEQKIKVDNTIKETYVNLKIAQMNGSAYLRTTDYKQYCNQKYANYPLENYVTYRTDSAVRKVWAVTIAYNLPEEIHFGAYYTYFIDVTTGEIIGGEEPLYTAQFDN